MPRDSNGIFTLESGYLAVAGATIQPSQHNPVLEDIGSAMTASLPRNGSAPMTDQLKLSDGTAALPALAFNSLAGMGVYKTATPGIGFSVGGALVFELTAAGPSIAGNFTVGATSTAALFRGSTLGSDTAPIYSFSGDTNTGVYSPAADALGFTTGGTLRLQITTGAVQSLLAVHGVDGAVGTPGFSFINDTDTGFYRSGANTFAAVTSGAVRMVWTSADIQNAGPQRIPNGSAAAPSITPSGDNSTGIFSPGTNTIAFSSSGAERMRISNGSGQPVVDMYGGARIIGSGSASGTNALYVTNAALNGLFLVRDDSLVQIPGAFAFTTANPANVNVDGTGSLARTTSSLRYKENVRDYRRGLADLAKLRPVFFNSKGGDGTDYAGFIAEEVHAAGMPEFVTYDAQGRPDALGYANMAALLVGALKEATAKIEALTSRIEALEG